MLCYGFMIMRRLMLCYWLRPLSWFMVHRRPGLRRRIVYDDYRVRSGLVVYHHFPVHNFFVHHRAVYYGQRCTMSAQVMYEIHMVATAETEADHAAN